MEDAGITQLPVRCIVVTTPNAKNVNDIFNNLGVPYVITFTINDEP